MLAQEISIDRVVDLEVLDRFLMSDRSPPGSMKLSDLDGFLTGIAIGPGTRTAERMAAVDLGRRCAGVQIEARRGHRSQTFSVQAAVILLSEPQKDRGRFTMRGCP